MDVFTQAVSDVIEEEDDLLVELGKIMHQQHKPFLNEEQALEANTNILKQHLLEKFRRRLDWLPTLPIDQIGLALAEEAMKFVDWRWIADKVR